MTKENPQPIEPKDKAFLRRPLPADKITEGTYAEYIKRLDEQRLRENGEDNHRNPSSTSHLLK